MTQPCRVAIYTRLSPNPEKDDTLSQEKQLLEYISRQEWELVEHYKDIHVSGGIKGKDRPRFSEMMEGARRRKFDLLLFWSLDRLSREGPYETMTYLRQLNDYGVDFKSYTEQYLDSCGLFKDAIVSLLGAIAHQEKIRIGERTRAGLRVAREKGSRLGRPPATVVSPKRKVAVDLEVIKKMRKEGLSYTKIGKKLSASGSTIWRLLKEKI